VIRLNRPGCCTSSAARAPRGRPGVEPPRSRRQALGGADPRSRERPSERGTDVTEVERAGAQREHGPGERRPAERLAPKGDACSEKSRPGHQAKDPSRRAVDEPREARAVECLVRANESLLSGTWWRGYSSSPSTPSHQGAPKRTNASTPAPCRASRRAPFEPRPSSTPRGASSRRERPRRRAAHIRLEPLQSDALSVTCSSERCNLASRWYGGNVHDSG
jgi:hypothetical protein